MTGLVRKAMLLGACGLFAAATAFANVPSPANSDVPTWIPLAGTQGGVPHPGQGITIVVRDFTNNVIAGSTVVLDFSACSDLNLCDLAIAGAGTVDCGAAGVAGNTVTATTNAFGEVSLTVIGGAINAAAGTPGAGANCVNILADGVDIGDATSYAIDENGAAGGNGVGGPDLSASSADVLAYLGGGSYLGRSSFAMDPGYTLAGVDLAAHKTLVLQSLGGNGSATGCDDGVTSNVYCP